MTELIENQFEKMHYKGRKTPKNSHKYYVVFRGRTLGIFDNWFDVHASVNKFPNAVYKSYPSYFEAERAWKNYILYGSRPYGKPEDNKSKPLF